jgi:hypothetical protein
VKQVKIFAEKTEQDRTALSEPGKQQLEQVEAVEAPALIDILVLCFQSAHKTTHQFEKLEQGQEQAFSQES